jgi:hypothetical protein
LAVELDNSKIRQIGKAAASSLGNTLMGKMRKQMKSKDKIGMVKFCQEQAELITVGVNNLLPDGVKVRRTTAKYRNLINKPKTLDLEAIKYFRGLQKSGTNVKKSFKIIKTKNSYTYYKPILMKKKCLVCHSSKSKMNPQILKTINRLFPNDKAYGYKKGDLRGLFVVEIDTKIYK